jgi:hypothetical protein
VPYYVVSMVVLKAVEILLVAVVVVGVVAALRRR